MTNKNLWASKWWICLAKDLTVCHSIPQQLKIIQNRLKQSPYYYVSIDSCSRKLLFICIKLKDSQLCRVARRTHQVTNGRCRSCKLEVAGGRSLLYKLSLVALPLWVACSVNKDLHHTEIENSKTKLDQSVLIKGVLTLGIVVLNKAL